MGTLEELIKAWQQDGDVGPNMVGNFTVPAMDAVTEPFPEALHPDVRKAMAKRGIWSLYSHQARAIGEIMSGHHVVMATPTASGKSLVYNLPVLSDLTAGKDIRALYLFPTKALAQDQYKELYRLTQEVGAPIKTFTYDGDTPADARARIREHGQVVLSNPDMLHTAVLPHHTKWVKLFSALKYIVIDEVHTYRGIFGSHLANVIRRLKRITEFYDTRPTFVLCSATIANPKELAERLIEEDVVLVDKSGAPRGERFVSFYNPPVVNQELGIRRSYIKEAVRLVTRLVERKVPTIVFALSRLNVELMVMYLRKALRERRIDEDLVQGYRGGYLPNHRRRIEKGLKEGDILAVVATNALELGIDIGHLTAAVIAGYPGSVASLLQQSGRAGRTMGASLTVVVGRSHPLDQFFMEHPGFLLERTPEHARLNPDNVFIVAEHVKCAAFELPFKVGEPLGRFGEPETSEILDFLASYRVLNRSGGHYHWMEDAYPANGVSLRNIPGENFAVIDVEKTEVIAEVDFKAAPETIHEHAIYNLAGVQYQVEELDWDNHKAYVRRVKPDYYTDAMTYNEVKVLREEGARPMGRATLGHGEVKTVERVVGFKKIKLMTHENLGYGDVVLPELTMHTTAFWITVEWKTLRALGFRDAEVPDAFHAAVYALKYAAIIQVMSDSHDIGRAVGDRSGTVEAAMLRPPAEGGEAPEDGFPAAWDPTMFLYDAYPGGVGFSQALFDDAEALVSRTVQRIVGCSCKRGCPSCTGVAGSHGGGKSLALKLFEAMGR